MNENQKEILGKALKSAIDKFNKESDVDPVKEVKIKRIELLSPDDDDGCEYKWVTIEGKDYWMCV